VAARAPARRDGRVARAAVGIACALGVALGVLVLRADAALGGLGRRAAAELIAPHVADGRRVWFLGHWGFQWYAQRAGARPVTITPPYPEPGDLLVTPSSGEAQFRLLRMLQARHPRTAHLARVEDARPGGRVMSPAAGAGFYSNSFGFLPWAWGREPVDTYDLWRLE
jgi:hypothetical protein